MKNPSISKETDGHMLPVLFNKIATYQFAYQPINAVYLPLVAPVPPL
jgi:hypothetical protein